MITYSDISKNTSMQRFAEYVRQGWHSAPEVLAALQSGETTPAAQAQAYFDVEETGGLSLEEATEVIEYCLQSPQY